MWLPGLTVSIPGLERALQQYTLEPSEKPFDLKSVPLATAPLAEQRAGKQAWQLHNLDKLCEVEGAGNSCPQISTPVHTHFYSFSHVLCCAMRGKKDAISLLHCIHTTAPSLVWLVTMCACPCRDQPHHSSQAARESGGHPAGDLPG